MTFRTWMVVVVALSAGCGGTDGARVTAANPVMPNPALGSPPAGAAMAGVPAPNAPAGTMSQPNAGSSAPTLLPQTGSPAPAQADAGSPQPVAGAAAGAPVAQGGSEAPPAGADSGGPTIATPPGPVPRIGFVSFAVADDTKAESFYVDQMGMKEQSRTPGADGTTEILLAFPDAPDSATLVLRYDATRNTPYEHGDAFSRLGFNVSDIAGLVMRLRSAGLTIIAGPTAATGLTWAQVRDPDGYTIEFLELSAPSRSALPRIGFVSLSVMDVMRAEDFYVQQLGMREQSRQPSGASTEIVLTFAASPSSATLVLMYSANRTTPYEAGDAFNRFGFAVSDLDGLVTRLGAASIDILKAPTAVSANGFSYAQVKDPDGYTTELVEYKP